MKNNIFWDREIKTKRQRSISFTRISRQVKNLNEERKSSWNWQFYHENILIKRCPDCFQRRRFTTIEFASMTILSFSQNIKVINDVDNFFSRLFHKTNSLFCLKVSLSSRDIRLTFVAMTKKPIDWHCSSRSLNSTASQIGIECKLHRHLRFSSLSRFSRTKNQTSLNNLLEHLFEVREKK